MAHLPFAVGVKAERAFGGFTIPSEISAGWGVDTERLFEFYRARLESSVCR